MVNHFVFAQATQLAQWRESGKIPNQLASPYFGAVQQNDVIWVIQRIDEDNADILARFVVFKVVHAGKKIELYSRVRPVMRVLGMKKAGLRAEFSDATGTMWGFVGCNRGGRVATKNPNWVRGFRTGWQLTQGTAQKFDVAWNSATRSPRIVANGDSPASLPIEIDRFDIAGIGDEKNRVVREIQVRRGQPDFRQKLIQAYGGRCAVTGCNAIAALEASHIIPYGGIATNHVANGLLLRSDIHTLFDLNLLGIDPKRRSIVVANELKGTDYEKLAGKKLREPEAQTDRPSSSALKIRWQKYR